MTNAQERRYLTVLLDNSPGEHYVARVFLEREHDGDGEYPMEGWEKDGCVSSLSMGWARCSLRLQWGRDGKRIGEGFYAHHEVIVDEGKLSQAERNLRWARVVDKARRAVSPDVDVRSPWTFIAMLAKRLRIPMSRLLVRVPGWHTPIYRDSECRYRLEESLTTWDAPVRQEA
jgi:hypothetical protein